MLRYTLLFLLWHVGACLHGQSGTGVWRGILSLEMETYTSSDRLRLLPSSDVRARPLAWVSDVSAGIQLLRPSINDSKAKLEFQQAGNRTYAVLTSYADDNSRVIMYRFNVWPRKNERYTHHLEGVGVVMNGSNKIVSELFDMRGSFVDTDSGRLFMGIWVLPESGRRMGSFVMGHTPEQLSLNPELFYQFIKKNKIQEDAIPAEHFPQPNAITDTLITNAAFIHGSLMENGVRDNDTLSIWLNGKLLEDDIVLGKKPYPFRIPLEEGSWNHLTIRCKSEGTMKGAGAHIGLDVAGKHMKYNLAFFQYHQANWVIGRE